MKAETINHLLNQFQALQGALKAIKAEDITQDDRQAIQGQINELEDILNSTDIMLNHCNTDCVLYASGMCRFVGDMANCPKLKKIVTGYEII